MNKKPANKKTAPAAGVSKKKPQPQPAKKSGKPAPAKAANKTPDKKQGKTTNNKKQILPNINVPDIAVRIAVLIDGDNARTPYIDETQMLKKIWQQGKVIIKSIYIQEINYSEKWQSIVEIYKIQKHLMNLEKEAADKKIIERVHKLLCNNTVDVIFVIVGTEKGYDEMIKFMKSVGKKVYLLRANKI